MHNIVVLWNCYDIVMWVRGLYSMDIVFMQLYCCIMNIMWLLL